MKPPWSAPPSCDGCWRRSTAARAKMVLVGDAYQLAPVKARGGMFEHLCDDLPWSQRLSRGVADARPRRTRRLTGAAVRRAATGCAKRSAGTATTTGCTPGTRSRWPPTPPPPTSTPAPRAKTSRSSATPGKSPTPSTSASTTDYTNHDAPSVPVARDQQVRAGDLIISRHNDATLTVEPGTRPPPR